MNIDLHRQQPAETVGFLLLVIAFFGWVGLFAYVGWQDTSTVIALVALMAVYLGFAIGGGWWRSKARWHFDRTSEALQEEADRHRVPHEEPRRLPPNVAQELVEALRDDPSHPLHPPAFLTLGQGVLISLGLAGTFYGLTAGLMGSVDKLSGNAKESALGMAILLGGAKLAFSKSLAGVVFAMVWGFYHHHLLRHRDRLFAALLRLVEESHPALSQEELLVRMITEQRQHREALDSRLLVLESGNQRRADALNELHRESRGVLDGRLTALANGQQSQVRILAEQQQRIADAVDAHLNAIWTRQQAQVAQMSEAVATSRLQAIQAIADAANGLAHHVDTLGQKLLHPDDGVLVEIRDKGQRIIELLDSSQATTSAPAAAPTGVLPSLSQLSADLKALSEAGGQAVSATIDGAVTEEAGKLQAALVALTKALGNLPEATKTNFEDSVANLTKALDKSRELTTGLTSAGTAVQVALSAVATPITEAKDSLVSVKDELDKVATKLASSATTAATAATEALSATNTLTEALGTAELVGDSTKKKIEDTVKDAKTVKEKVTQESEAARTKLTEALQAGAEELARASTMLNQTMLQSAAYSTQIAENLSTAETVTLSIATAANEANAALTGAAAPLQNATTAIAHVPNAIISAQTTLASATAGLQGLLTSLEKAQIQAQDSQTIADERITNLNQRYAQLLQQIPGQLTQLTNINEQIRSAWEQAHRATTVGVETNAKQIATYAERVEKALQYPHNLANLTEAITELTDANQALHTFLKGKTT